ncbi:MAG TPA: DUF4445 domain-containing protein, partial [Nitrospirae bacterium]|nr:DUF4445 domain-containing protein [Nitrospirota bacterium]
MKIILPSEKSIPVEPGVSVFQALKKEGVHLTSSCGGKGTCGKCKIIVKSGPVDTRSTTKLTKGEIKKGAVLACQSFPRGDIQIEIPKESELIVEGKIATGKSKDLQELLHSTGAKREPLTRRIVLQLPPPSLNDNISDLERLKREFVTKGLGCLRVPFRFLINLAGIVRKKDWEITLSTINAGDCCEITNISPGNRTSARYGIAIDIGTTTVVAYLIDLNDGTLVDIASTYNSQIQFGDDVITRIIYVEEHNALKSLHRTIIVDINDLISLLRKTHTINIDSIDSLVTAGNPTMTHIFLGLDPASIRQEPYIPTANSFPVSHAGELGIKTNPNTPVYTFPCVSSYVGGDIVSGVLASRLHKSQ